MTMEDKFALVQSDEFKAKIEAFNKDWHKFYKEISKEETPQVDGTGRKIVDKRPDGLDYIIEAYMRECLDRHFPGWSWEGTNNPVQFLGSEWVQISAHLLILDMHLLAFGINPPYRKFLGVAAARIMYKSGRPHTPENIVDIDKNVKAGNSNAFKVAVNRLTHIGDDVYGKRIEEEGAGTVETVFETDPHATNFTALIEKYRIPWSEVFKILDISSATEIKDFKEAWEKIKQHKKIK